MKTGICYMVFDGEELLEFAIKSIRKTIDYVAVTYQDISYFGNEAHPSLKQTLFKLKDEKLIDELIFYKTDFSISQKENELNLRNLGLEYSKKNGCTHHISADVDEFYKEKEFVKVLDLIDKQNYDFTFALQEIYYKDPTWLITPNQDMRVTFIHPVDNFYAFNENFPFHIEVTRRMKNHENYLIINPNDFVIHHMSYVRKDILRKFDNSSNKNYYDIKNFMNIYNKYNLGDKVFLLPDYVNRTTVLTPNYFNINI